MSEVPDFKFDWQSVRRVLRHNMAYPVNETIDTVGAVNLHILQREARRIGMSYDEFSQGIERTTSLEQLVLGEFVPNRDFVTALENVDSFMQEHFPESYDSRSDYEFFIRETKDEQAAMKSLRKANKKSFPQSTKDRLRLWTLDTLLANLPKYATDRSLPEIASFGREISTLSTKARTIGEPKVESRGSGKKMTITASPAYVGLLSPEPVLRYFLERAFVSLGSSSARFTQDDVAVDFALDTGKVKLEIDYEETKPVKFLPNAINPGAWLSMYLAKKIRAGSELRVKETELLQRKIEHTIDRICDPLIHEAREELLTDEATGQHEIRVYILAKLLGRMLGLPPEEYTLIDEHVLLHDKGKDKIPPLIKYDATKRGEDFDEEKSRGMFIERYRLMQKHTEIGFFRAIKSAHLFELERAQDEELLGRSDEDFFALLYGNQERKITGRAVTLLHQAAMTEGLGYYPDLGMRDLPLFLLPVICADKFDAIGSSDRTYTIKSDFERIAKIFSFMSESEEIHPDIATFFTQQFMPALEAAQYDRNTSWNFNTRTTFSPEETAPLVAYLIGHTDTFDIPLPSEIQELVKRHPRVTYTRDQSLRIIEENIVGLNDELKLIERLRLLKEKADADSTVIPDRLQSALAIASYMQRDNIAEFAPKFHLEQREGIFTIGEWTMRLNTLQEFIPLEELVMPTQVGYIIHEQKTLGPFIDHPVYFPHEAPR